MAGEIGSQRLVRASVASLVCASAAVITAALLARSAERSAVLVAANGGFAVAAAIFATAGAEAALRSRAAESALPSLASPATSARDDLRACLDRIARVAQAGTIGDARAAAYAFAMIARQVGEASALLER